MGCTVSAPLQTVEPGTIQELDGGIKSSEVVFADNLCAAGPRALAHFSETLAHRGRAEPAAPAERQPLAAHRAVGQAAGGEAGGGCRGVIRFRFAGRQADAAAAALA